jgi:hypothetical protein
MKLISILFLFIVSIIYYSCSGDGDCLKSSGPETTEERFLSNFKSIEIHDLFNVYLVNDTISKITVETGKNLMSAIKTEVSDSVLNLSNTSRCRFLRGYGNYPKLTIHVKNLQLLRIYEPCNVFTVDTLKIDDLHIIFNADVSTADICLKSNYLTLDLWSDVTGEYKICGAATNFISTSHGFSVIDAKNLKSDFVILNSMSTGDYTVNVQSKLSVTVQSSGNVYYYGNPVITENIKGTGQIIKGN